ncbi:MAG TPA: NAD(P)/FAD-dependent oxidoreductase [Methanoregulaceae archaeon]|nr:MAG: NAD(P)/FAD-dependent oxidoreductase [Methanolinea sp.]HON81372.1 NAD(P)/FAD-dependent oxidoreductase [Methanoregulaceae archaeon]HPD09764.1 NAD(P)/FAD-dependent oxidoreductase [Methanoregulaceae archaeon]HRT14515.1 NAD(P)/FAD-dependent oxidoreductase [Methanoregulaceae archaeon]HRU30086.1 NAD(P)/FAD-dependent oxidoreductase [Methanoregulaceae archaeon]
MRTYDVVVIGAGPAGSMAARLCAGQGLSVCLIEEHGTIGHPVQCAGLLSVPAFHECGVSRKSVLHEVSGARIRSAQGSELYFDAGRTRAVIVDRGMLDREMAMQAAGAGAEVRLKTAYRGKSGSAVRTRGVRGREEVGFRVLIAADGPGSPVARSLGMPRPPVFLAGLQAEIRRDMDQGAVELYPDASPEFFGWIIPIGAGRARIGLAGTQDVFGRFRAFYRGAGGGSIINLVSGTIPLGVMERTYGHGTLFIGDAAGFPKPTSGGGVFTGVRSAAHAAAVAAEAIRKHDTTDAVLCEYEKRWKADFGRELALGIRFFRLRQQLSPADIDRLIAVLDDPATRAEICRYGDMDRPGAIIRRLLRNPKVVPVLGILLRGEISRILRG